MPVVHEGGCLCGDVRYARSPSPLRVTICHCTFCQRFTGSAYPGRADLSERASRLCRNHAEDLRASLGQQPQARHAAISAADARRRICLILERFPEVLEYAAARSTIRTGSIAARKLSPHLHALGAEGRRPAGGPGNLPGACDAARRNPQPADNTRPRADGLASRAQELRVRCTGECRIM